MANLQPPILPGRLHRYRSFDRPDGINQEIDAIRNNYIFCSNFSKMNDPMEGFYRSSNLLKQRPGYKDLVGKITNQKSGIGIGCLCERDDNVLMWAHYASHFKGICISYSGTALHKGLSDQIKLVRVAYVNEPPLLFPSHVGNAENAASRILSLKQEDWSYEREWRILGPEGRIQIERKDAIKEIAFGLRTTKEHRELILDAISGTEIVPYEMVVTDYGIEWEKFEAKSTIPIAKKPNSKAAGSPTLKKAKKKD